MKKVILAAILRLARMVGFFALARRITARDLRILCYHGAALRDENEFRPGLFMTSSEFSARMQLLAEKNYPVLPLDEALEHLANNDLASGSTVITIDDGWYGTCKIMVPILHRHRFPSTLYVASYYLEKQTQVFNVAAAYLLWRGGDRVLDLAVLGHGMSGSHRLARAPERNQALEEICGVSGSIPAAKGRQDLLQILAEALDVDWSMVQGERLISFMNEDEARDAVATGVSVQLHTHRHRFPNSSLDAARNEIDDNRSALADIAATGLVHFCYPSGEYTPNQIPWLQQLGIVSATTTKRGFNRCGGSPYELTRFLDSGDVSQLEFEAEMCGFFELVRRCGYAI